MFDQKERIYGERWSGLISEISLVKEFRGSSFSWPPSHPGAVVHMRASSPRGPPAVINVCHYRYSSLLPFLSFTSTSEIPCSIIDPAKCTSLEGSLCSLPNHSFLFHPPKAQTGASPLPRESSVAVRIPRDFELCPSFLFLIPLLSPFHPRG